MAQTAPAARPRPLSPFLIWRWHITMATSILHRATGVALYGGALILALWAFTLASGGAAYGAYIGVLGSIPGQVVLFAVTVSVLYHLANGVRHLVWDAGVGLDVKTSDLTAWIALAVGVIGAAALWALILAKVV